MKTAVVTASSQNAAGKPFALSMLLGISTMV
jgi:hypothetical protein